MIPIQEIAAALYRAQRVSPQRVGQIIGNAVSLASGPAMDDDPYYLTDEKLARALTRYAEYLEEHRAVHRGEK